jgi:hypothetical protein
LPLRRELAMTFTENVPCLMTPEPNGAQIRRNIPILGAIASYFRNPPPTRL